jgi:hypothetical protein
MKEEKMKDENKFIKEIPYGITDYELIRRENYYYERKRGARRIKFASNPLHFLCKRNNFFKRRDPVFV